MRYRFCCTHVLGCIMRFAGNHLQSLVALSRNKSYAIDGWTGQHGANRGGGRLRNDIFVGRRTWPIINEEGPHGD